MAITFPNGPTEGQVHNVSAGNSFVYRDGLWLPAPMNTAMPKNFLINPAMQISQQNAETAGTTDAYFVADQWCPKVSGIVISAGRTTSTDGTRIQTSVTTGKALAVTDYWFYMQVIEGQRIADWEWSTANAKQLVTTFDLYTNVAGTYTFCMRNFSGNRSFTANFAASASVWNRPTIVIPGDQTVGAWVKTSAGSALWSITFAAGTNHIAGTAGWNAGGAIGATGLTNGALTTGNVFYMKNTGLYLDPYKTGVAPSFEVPDYYEETRRCQRYWTKIFGSRGWQTAATGANRMGFQFPVPMRIAPALTVVATPKVNDTTTTVAVSAPVASSQSNTFAGEMALTTATLVAARPAGHIWDADTSYIAASARM